MSIRTPHVLAFFLGPTPERAISRRPGDTGLNDTFACEVHCFGSECALGSSLPDDLSGGAPEAYCGFTGRSVNRGLLAGTGINHDGGESSKLVPSGVRVMSKDERSLAFPVRVEGLRICDQPVVRYDDDPGLSGVRLALVRLRREDADGGRGKAK
jgi:hypothetical protein